MRFNPKVSIIMPVHNGENFLHESINSILTQTMQDFELIIINDASTDSSLKIISSYDDSRIRVLQNQVNQGISVSLNNGISLASSPVIARMDCDDICVDSRLQTQYDFMIKNENISICGTSIDVIDSEGHTLYSYKAKQGSDTIKAILLCGGTGIAHPTVMIRSSFLRNNNLSYNTNYTYAEDYELWGRCSQYGDFENLEERLVLYRIHHQSVGSSHYKSQRLFARLALMRLLRAYNIPFTSQEAEYHFQLSLPLDENIDANYYASIEKWIDKLIALNRQHLWVSPDAFNKVVLNKLEKIKSKID